MKMRLKIILFISYNFNNCFRQKKREVFPGTHKSSLSDGTRKKNISATRPRTPVLCSWYDRYLLNNYHGPKLFRFSKAWFQQALGPGGLTPPR